MNSEAWRQRQLLDALWAPQQAAIGPFDAAGLAAYRGNAAAAAERALAGAYPTVRQLVGDAAFGAIARQLWRQSPPRRGDLAEWGDVLPAFLGADAALADEPYLADVARVDWAVHRAEIAADATLDPACLARLAAHDAATLRLRLVPGAACVDSPHPVATIWVAHRSQAADRFVPVRAAFAAGRAETAFVWRRGWRGEVCAVDSDVAGFLRSLAAGRTLAAALDAHPALDFEAWLTQAVGRQWLADVEVA